jgi:hypothetical protein
MLDGEKTDFCWYCGSPTNLSPQELQRVNESAQLQAQGRNDAAFYEANNFVTSAASWSDAIAVFWSLCWRFIAFSLLFAIPVELFLSAVRLVSGLKPHVLLGIFMNLLAFVIAGVIAVRLVLNMTEGQLRLVRRKLTDSKLTEASEG